MVFWKPERGFGFHFSSRSRVVGNETGRAVLRRNMWPELFKTLEHAAKRDSEGAYDSPVSRGEELSEG
jgi:hypothetical protein